MECQELDRSQVRTFLASEHSTPARSKKGVFSGASIYPQSSIFPQQRKLMGSSAQNSSGVHWCRRRVRFNQVPEKVPEKVWEALVQSQVRFNRVPEKVPEKIWEALVQSQVRFNRICGHFIHGNFQRLASQHVSERFVKIKRCGCWGYHRSLFWMDFQL